MSPRVATLRRILDACGRSLDLRAAAAMPDVSDLDSIQERLRWSPRERLQYLVDMVAFEERARAAKRS